jgi:hypothetical protein
VSTAAYLVNRTMNSAHPDVTPDELCFKVKPQLDHLHAFGSYGYAHADDAKCTKLETNSYMCMLLGYADGTKGYKVLDIDASVVKVSRSVALDEREVNGIYDAAVTPFNGPVTQLLLVKDGADHPAPLPVTPYEPMVDEATADDDVAMGKAPPQLSPAPPSSDVVVFHPPVQHSGQPREEQRVLPTLESAPHQRLLLETIRRRGVYGSIVPRPSPERLRVDDDEYALAVMAHAAAARGSTDVPSSCEQEMASCEKKQWKAATRDELAAHDANGTWRLVSRKAGMRTIGSRWVFAKKRDEHGNIARYKVRLVARGSKQEFGVNFFETYSPVAKTNSIRVFLATCTSQGYEMKQPDVDTAFLNSDQEEEVFMEVPKGLDVDGNMVLKLNKAMCGLNQTSSAWNKITHRVFVK